MSHRRAMITVTTLFALCTVASGVLIARYNTTHRSRVHPVAGTPFTLRDGPSRTPERYAAWEHLASRALVAFQDYARAHLGGGIQRPVDVILNADMTCDGRPASGAVDGESADHTICLYLSALPHTHGGLVQLVEAAAHEAAHVWANERGCTTIATLMGDPDRMNEGIAGDLAWRVLTDGPVTASYRAQHLAALRREARSLRRHPDDPGAHDGLIETEGEIDVLSLEDGHPERFATYCREIAATDHDERTATLRAFGRLG